MRQFDRCPFATAPEADVAWKEAVQTYGKCPGDHAELEHPPFLQLFNLADRPSRDQGVQIGKLPLMVSQTPEKFERPLLARASISLPHGIHRLSSPTDPGR